MASFNYYYYKARADRAALAARQARKSQTFDDSTWTAINTAMADLNDELDASTPDTAKIRKLVRRLENLHSSPGTITQDMVNGGLATTNGVFAGDKSRSYRHQDRPLFSDAKFKGPMKEPTSDQIISALEEYKESERRSRTPYMPTGNELQQKLVARNVSQGVRFNAELGRWVKA